MKATNILAKSKRRRILGPLKLQTQLIYPIKKKIVEEIGIVRLLTVIFVTSTIIGILVFFGLKFL